MPLMSACVMLPVLQEVDIDTSCLRRVRPSVVSRRLHNICGVASHC
jgi:hypothetical protein